MAVRTPVIVRLSNDMGKDNMSDPKTHAHVELLALNTSGMIEGWVTGRYLRILAAVQLCHPPQHGAAETSGEYGRPKAIREVRMS
jgi:hypothetical protein